MVSNQYSVISDLAGRETGFVREAGELGHGLGVFQPERGARRKDTCVQWPRDRKWGPTPTINPEGKMNTQSPFWSRSYTVIRQRVRLNLYFGETKVSRVRFLSIFCDQYSLCDFGAR